MMTLILLCLVEYLSARHIKYHTFQYESIGHVTLIKESSFGAETWLITQNLKPEKVCVVQKQRRRLRVENGATAPGPALEGAPRFRLQTSTIRVRLKLCKLLFLIRVFMLFEK